jgi:hypothetical protein
MKVLFIITFFLSAFGGYKYQSNGSVKHHTDKKKQQLSKKYKVYKIDSLENLYLIYARKNDSIYKIISQNQKENNCKNIKVNGVYCFKLHSRFESKFLGKYRMSPKALPHVSGYNFYGTIVTLEGDSIRDLYYAENIKGLCFIKRKK